MDPSSRTGQSAIDEANAAFWDELCGTTLAKALGITDHSEASLKRFDDAYFTMYPYLLSHVPVDRMRGMKVLEVGLGYGTLGQAIANAGAEYTGVDISPGPVRMMNHRLGMHRLTGRAIEASILESGLPSESQDWVVAIGCYHHTGNMQRAVDESFRILKPGGNAMIMVYNSLSLRQWQQWPKDTLRRWLHQYEPGFRAAASESQRNAYDSHVNGQTAPETEFFSRRSVRQIFGRFSKVSVRSENADEVFIPIPRYDKVGKRFWLDRTANPYQVPRPVLLATIGRTLGLDLYIAATK